MRSISQAQSSKLLLALSSILLAVGVMALGAALVGRRHADHDGPRGDHPQQGQAFGTGHTSGHRPQGEQLPHSQVQQQQGPQKQMEHMPRPQGQQQHDQKPHRACRFTLALAVMAIVAGAVGQYAGWKASPCAAKVFILLVVVLSVMHVMALHRGVGMALQHCEERGPHQQMPFGQIQAQPGSDANKQETQPELAAAKPIDQALPAAQDESRDAPRGRKAMEQLRKPEADEAGKRLHHGGASHGDACRHHVRRVLFAIGAASQLFLFVQLVAAVVMIRAVRKAGMTLVPTADDVVVATVVAKADPLADDDAPVSSV